MIDKTYKFSNVSLGTTCLTAMAMTFALSTASNEANAAEKMKIGISGSIASVVAFGTQDGAFESTASATTRTGYDSINVWNDSEVHFTGSTKLDNGITASVVIQLETDAVNGGSTIDESYTKLTGGFGDIRIGSTKSASNTLSTTAPAVGFTGPNDGDGGNVIVQPSAVGVSPDTLLASDDDMKLVYYSPSFSGFQVGASYKPSNASSDNMPSTGGTAGTDVQSFDVALGYGGKMGSVDLTADVSYAENHGNVASSSKGYRAGLKLGFGAIEVGGSYREFSEIDTGANTLTTNPEEEAFDIGVSYASGPYAVSVSYLGVSAPKASGTRGDDESSQLFLGASYSMGPGVDLLGNVFRIEWEDEATTDGNNNDGWGALAAISVSF